MFDITVCIIIIFSFSISYIYLDIMVKKLHAIPYILPSSNPVASLGFLLLKAQAFTKVWHVS